MERERIEQNVPRPFLCTMSPSIDFFKPGVEIRSDGGERVRKKLSQHKKITEILGFWNKTVNPHNMDFLHFRIKGSWDSWIFLAFGRSSEPSNGQISHAVAAGASYWSQMAPYIPPKLSPIDLEIFNFFMKIHIFQKSQRKTMVFSRKSAPELRKIKLAPD